MGRVVDKYYHYPPLFIYREVYKPMEYSKITSVEVFNFMVFSHAMAYFDDDNIVNIKGYNSSGKSTLLRAVVVCLLNMYPKSQTKFIRHGEKYFRVTVNFSDGVSLTRDKYISGQSLYEMYKDGERVFTTKEGDRLTKVDEVPQIIQDYLGLCVVNTGCLNYQIRQDPLWLVDTTGSENYTAFNEILKSEELSRANSMLNSDKNKLNSDIVGIEASLQETKMALVDASAYTEGLLSRLNEHQKAYKELKARYELLTSIYQIVSDLGTIQILPTVDKIDGVRLDKIQGIDDILMQYGKLNVPPVIDKVSEKRLSDIDRVLGLIKGIPENKIPDVSLMDTERALSIAKLYQMMSDVRDCNSQIKACKTELGSVSTRLEGIVQKAKSKGIRFVQCDNCGTYIEVKNEGA